MINASSFLKRPFASNKQATHTGTIPLSMLSSGDHGIIKGVRGKGETKSFLENLGFLENTNVTVVSKLGGSMIINIKGSKIAVNKDMATKIMAVPA